MPTRRRKLGFVLFGFFGIIIPYMVSETLTLGRARYGQHAKMWGLFDGLWLLSHVIIVCLATVAFPVIKAVMVHSEGEGCAVVVRRIAVAVGLLLLVVAYVVGILGMIAFW